MWVAVSFLYPHLHRSVSRRGSRALIQNFFPKEGGGGGEGGGGWGVNIFANQMSKHYHLKLDWNKSAFRGWGESTICQFWTIYLEGDPLSTH